MSVVTFTHADPSHDAATYKTDSWEGRACTRKGAYEVIFHSVMDMVWVLKRSQNVNDTRVH